MDKKDFLLIKHKKDPLRTEMRRAVEFLMQDGMSNETIIAELNTWNEKDVKDILSQLKYKKQPEKYYTSIREPLLSDKFK
ncbi:MAG: hypothetical protein ABIH34_03535 [Nanoarchaeota archaeon]